MRLLFPEQFRAAGWTRVRWAPMARLTNRAARPWRLEKAPKGAPSVMRLVAPDGRVWQFRMQRGMWIKRVEVKK